MKKELIDKIINDHSGSYDTRKYRYIAKECYDHEKQWIEIRRLPLEKLGTTSALSDWETVEIIE